jgi:hypothetical protein
MYDHHNGSSFTEQKCTEAVGKRVQLPLTGRIVASGRSENGPFVVFKVDERWGFDDLTLGVDLDALQVDESS